VAASLAKEEICNADISEEDAQQYLDMICEMEHSTRRQNWDNRNGLNT